MTKRILTKKLANYRCPRCKNTKGTFLHGEIHATEVSITELYECACGCKWENTYVLTEKRVVN